MAKSRKQAYLISFAWNDKNLSKSHKKETLENILPAIGSILC